MRVLFLNQTFYPDPVATSQYLAELAEAIAQRGHEVTVLTSRRAYQDPRLHHPAEEIWKNIRIIRVGQTGWGKTAKWRRALDFASFFLAATLRAFFLRRADVVVALTSPPLFSVLGALLTLLRGGRFIYWVMDLNPDEAVAAGWLRAGSMAATSLEKISRWSLRRAHRIVVLDRYLQERIVAKGIAPVKVEIIPLWPQVGIAFTAEGRGEVRRQLGWEQKRVMMYAGNHSPCHPLDPLLEVAQRLQGEPEFHFCFCGGGSEWGRLQLKAQGLGLKNVEFLTYRPFSELSALLSAADIQVVVMGAPFVGLIHPCKIYNILAVGCPVFYVGPRVSHVSDLLRETAAPAMSFLPDEMDRMVLELRNSSLRETGICSPVEIRSADWLSWLNSLESQGKSYKFTLSR